MPKKQYIIERIESAIKKIQDKKLKDAEDTLVKLREKLSGTKPAAPRVANAYAVFVKDNFKKVQSEHPSKSAKELMPIIAEMWADKKKKK